MLRKLVEQAASIAGLRIVGTGLGVAVSIILARAFGTEVLGVYAYCIALMMLASVPISYGWGGMLLRSVAKEGELDALSRAMARYGTFGAFGMALLAALAGYAALRIGRTDIAAAIAPVGLGAIGLLAMALLADQISALRMASLRGIDRPALAQLPEMMLRPIFLIGGIGVLWFAVRPEGIAQVMLGVFGAVALAAVLSAIFGQWILSRITQVRQLREVDREMRRGWITSAAALAGSAGLVQLNGYVDLVFLGNLGSAEDVGHYRAALQIAMLANFGYMALNMLAGQRFSKFLAQGDKQSAAKAASHLSRLALLAAIPFPIALLVCGEWIFSFLFGDDFAQSALPALIVSLGFCFSAMIGMAHSLLIMSHGEFITIRITAAALAVNVMMCLLLIPPHGLVGAALSNVIASVLWNTALWYFARKKDWHRFEHRRTDSRHRYGRINTIFDNPIRMIGLNMKAVLRQALILKPVSKVAVAIARTLPGNWQRRLPVNVPLSILKLEDESEVALAQPYRCHVAQEIYWGDGQLSSKQDRNALKAALAFSRDAATFLDIGSYTGLFALAVARANPRIQAFAYEIVGENYLLLWENVLHNDLGAQVHPRLIAVGGEDGEIRIPSTQSTGQLASSVDIGWSTDHGVHVPMKRLEDLHLDSPGPVALKIDVEGCEMEVFDGANAFLEKHRPDMVCEVLRRAKRLPEMMELLGGLGYRWFHIREDGFAQRDTIIADKLCRDWVLTCKSDVELRALGLVLID